MTMTYNSNTTKLHIITTKIVKVLELPTNTVFIVTNESQLWMKTRTKAKTKNYNTKINDI